MKFSLPELLIVLLIVVVIFGPTQIPKLTRMLGKSVKNFRDGMADDENAEPQVKHEDSSEK